MSEYKRWKPSLWLRFIAYSRVTWNIAYILLNIDQPRRARRHFKANHPWVFCERVK